MTAKWDDLDPIWQRCVELAWESYREGSIPVGCVIAGPDASLVAKGRNRAFVTEPADTGLGGTYIVHAEFNALSQLLPGDYPDHTV